LIDNLINFLKSRTFIYAAAGILILVLGYNLMTYFNAQKNKEEFLNFVEINEGFGRELGTAEELYDQLDLDFQNYGYELITKSILSRKALDESNYNLALELYLEIYSELASSSISNQTKYILLEQYAENIVRLFMQLDKYEEGKEFIATVNSDFNTFNELVGDFHKFFGQAELANEYYDKALSADLNDTQKNLIKLKKIP